MKAAVRLALVLALTWVPRPPTWGLRGFLEGLGLEALCKSFVRKEVDLAVMREMNKQDFWEDWYWSDGPEDNTCRSSCSTRRRRPGKWRQQPSTGHCRLSPAASNSRDWSWLFFSVFYSIRATTALTVVDSGSPWLRIPIVVD